MSDHVTKKIYKKMPTYEIFNIQSELMVLF